MCGATDVEVSIEVSVDVSVDLCVNVDHRAVCAVASDVACACVVSRVVEHVDAPLECPGQKGRWNAES